MNLEDENKALLPEVSQKTSLERRYIKQILKSDPGIGDKCVEIARSLADSGFTPAAASMILQSVYSPAVAGGNGQASRIRWFTEAIQTRYASRLDRIKTDYKAFRSFLSDMEEVTEMRDTLNGNGFTFTFHQSFLMWELGEDANSIMGMVYDLQEKGVMSTVAIVARIVKAALEVQRGTFSEVRTAVEFLNPE